MINDIKEIFEVIPKYPGLNICLIDGFGIKDKFINFSTANEATLYLKDYDGSIDKSLDLDFIKVEKFSFDDKRYNHHSVLYDFVFVCLDTDGLDMPNMLKKFYRVIKNAGYIYLFAKKDEADSLVTLLEETNYVSVNIIDDYKDTKLISAQKMHGWMRV